MARRRNTRRSSRRATSSPTRTPDPRRPREALRLIIEEITQAAARARVARELADAQAYLEGSFPLTIETPERIAAQVLNAMFYGLPLSDIENYREMVQQDHARRHSARGAAISSAGSAVGGARRRRRCFHEGPRRCRVHSVRAVNLPELDLTSVHAASTAANGVRSSKRAVALAARSARLTHADRHGVLRRGVGRSLRRRARDGAAASRPGHTSVRPRRTAARRGRC